MRSRFGPFVFGLLFGLVVAGGLLLGLVRHEHSLHLERIDREEAELVRALSQAHAAKKEAAK